LLGSEITDLFKLKVRLDSTSMEHCGWYLSVVKLVAFVELQESKTICFHVSNSVWLAFSDFSGRVNHDWDDCCQCFNF
jgi:hypothetical protein